MKRIAAALLTTLLLLAFCLFPLSTFATEAAPQNGQSSSIHEIWNIPWGITMDEFIETAYQKTGLVFEPQKNEDGIVDRCVCVGTQNHTVLTYPLVKATAYFSKKDGEYNVLLVSLSEALAFADFDYIVAMFDGLFSDLLSQYSLFEKPHFVVTDRENGKALSFDLPRDGSRLNQAELLTITEIYQFIWLEARFDNISLDCYITYYEPRNSFRYSLTLSASANLPNPFFVENLGSYSEYLDEHPTPTPTPGPTPEPTPVSLGF